MLEKSFFFSLNLFFFSLFLISSFYTHPSLSLSSFLSPRPLLSLSPPHPLFYHFGIAFCKYWTKS